MSQSTTDNSVMAQAATVDAALKASGVRSLITQYVTTGQGKVATSTTASDSTSPPWYVYALIAGAALLGFYLIRRRA